MGGENSAILGLMSSFQPPSDKCGGQAENETAGFWLGFSAEIAVAQIRMKTS